ncbi:RDD family protein [Actinomyces oris]|uniref:RDD family protein n=2 Tax=Actinomyces oris TaxID=544580 RepID=A0AAE4G0A2_9ACTO|nr:RDD family protein [Actinomyces oris]MDT0247486.1 RDD family protein [Actinomyces oris]
MTITADARSSASTAAGPPESSRRSDDATRTDVVSPYGTAPSTPDSPHGGAQTADSRGSEPGAARTSSHTTSSAHRRLPPAPVRARVVAGVIDLVIGSLLVGGLTAVIWRVGGRPVLTSGLIAFGLVVGARWLTIAATGWSLGGRLLRIRMLGARHQTPSPLGSFLHADLILAVSITTLGLGTIALMRTAAADPEGRGWHDKLSGMALLSARRTKRPARPVSSATEPQGRPATEPDSSSPRADAGAEAPEASSAQDIGEAWDAARRASLSSSESSSGGQSTTSQEPAAAPSSPATEAPDESASRTQHSERAERKAEKKAGKAARGKKARKRGPRPGSTRARSGQEAAQEAQQATTAGPQSSTEAGATESSGRSAHPTTSDPVSSSIRRPRPARPGRPARHAGRALSTGSSSGYASTASETSAEEQALSTAAAATTATSQSAAKATKAATVSSSASAKSAASAGPAIVETDAQAVAVASATPMDPQASAAMAAARAESRPAVEKSLRPPTGPVDEDAVATAPEALEDTEAATSPTQEDTEPAPATPTEATEPTADDTAPEASSEPISSAPATEAEEPAEEAQEAADEHAEEPVEEPVDEPAADVEEPSNEPSEADVEEPQATASSSSDDAASQQPSPMDTETATLDVVEDAPSQPTDDTDSRGDGAEKPSTHAPPSSEHPADQQQSEATTPSAESSKTADDSEASQSSTSHDATSTPQVPRSQATEPVTSQAMEPRHAHAQRWRIQPGHTGKKASGSSAAPTEDQRESVSQPGVPRRESLFTTERQRFAAGAGPVPEVAHTFDTSSILPSGDRNTQALIDSVPWSSVPTSVDAATVDSLPEGVVVSDDGLPQQPTTVSAPAQHASPMDLTNPATVPGGVPAASEGTAHPTVRSHRSHARTSAGSATSAAVPEETPSRRPHASHRFAGPGIPSPTDGRAVPSESRSDARAADAGTVRHERSASVQAPEQPRTGVSRRSAGSVPEAAAPVSSPAAGASRSPLTPVPDASAQTATPSLPSASSAAPALSVRLVPLLGGNPILIHEPTVVGRDPDNISAYPGAERVALDDPTRSVSKTHAAIFPLLDGVWVTDLHSTNGTRVEYRDGRTVEAVPDKALSALEGSTIFFGRIAFKVEVV